jgi:hypothetical protein
MQPAKGQRKPILSALMLVVVVAVPASTAIGRTGPPVARSSSVTLLPCTSGHCSLNSKTTGSTISVVPTQVPAGQKPSFTAATHNPAQGMLHGQRMTGVLDCAGYQATDTAAYQFFLGGTFRGNVIYKVTDTVNTTKSPSRLQFCLGATFSFATSSGKPAKAAKLPNGLSGFVGLVPSCAKPPTAPCLVSKTRDQAGSRNVVLKVLIPAVEGADPWGRA